MRGKKAKSRARLALRAVACAAAFIAALNLFAGVGYLLPRQAVRAQERALGVAAPTEVLLRVRGSEVGVRGLVYLTASEEALCLSFAELTAAGWVAHGQALDCTADAPAVFATRREGWADERYEQARNFIFGCVRDDAVVSASYIEIWESGESETAVTDWVSHGARRCFLLSAPSGQLMLEGRIVKLTRADGSSLVITPS